MLSEGTGMVAGTFCAISCVGGRAGGGALTAGGGGGAGGASATGCAWEQAASAAVNIVSIRVFIGFSSSPAFFSLGGRSSAAIPSRAKRFSRPRRPRAGSCPTTPVRVLLSRWRACASSPAVIPGVELSRRTERQPRATKLLLALVGGLGGCHQLLLRLLDQFLRLVGVAPHVELVGLLRGGDLLHRNREVVVRGAQVGMPGERRRGEGHAGEQSDPGERRARLLHLVSSLENGAALRCAAALLPAS